MGPQIFLNFFEDVSNQQNKKNRSSLARAAKARKKMRFSPSHLPAYEANSAGKNFFVKSDIFIKFDPNFLFMEKFFRCHPPQDFYLVLFFFSAKLWGLNFFSLSSRVSPSTKKNPSERSEPKPGKVCRFKNFSSRV
jgi:hypothetical protein